MVVEGSDEISRAVAALPVGVGREVLGTDATDGVVAVLLRAPGAELTTVFLQADEHGLRMPDQVISMVVQSDVERRVATDQSGVVHGLTRWGFAPGVAAVTPDLMWQAVTGVVNLDAVAIEVGDQRGQAVPITAGDDGRFFSLWKVRWRARPAVWVHLDDGRVLRADPVETRATVDDAPERPRAGRGRL